MAKTGMPTVNQQKAAAMIADGALVSHLSLESVSIRPRLTDSSEVTDRIRVIDVLSGASLPFANELIFHVWELPESHPFYITEDACRNEDSALLKSILTDRIKPLFDGEVEATQAREGLMKRLFYVKSNGLHLVMHRSLIPEDQPCLSTEKERFERALNGLYPGGRSLDKKGLCRYVLVQKPLFDNL